MKNFLHQVPQRAQVFYSNNHFYAAAAKKESRHLEKKISLFKRSASPVLANIFIVLSGTLNTARTFIFEVREEYFNTMLAPVTPNSSLLKNSILHISPVFLIRSFF